MIENIRASLFKVIAAITILLSTVNNCSSFAESNVFSGITSSITPDKECKEKPENDEIVLVFDGEPENAASGWFYGKKSSPAEFRRISPMHFEVTYPITRYNNLPPSHMELHPGENGFKAVIRDYIPEDQQLRESICYFEKMEVLLQPQKDPMNTIKMRAKDLFSVELIMQECEYLIFNQRDYQGAEAQGRKALTILERVYGKLSTEALNASVAIAFALMGLDRFDEALAVIAPYRKALPDNKDLMMFDEILQKAKKDQDELFRYDPDSKSDIDLEPLAYTASKYRKLSHFICEHKCRRVFSCDVCNQSA